MKTEPLTVRKSFEIKAATLDDNCIKGAASVTGVMDRGRDVIFPGAWQKSLKDFLANGFVAVGHAWDQLPVAMPEVAKEQGNELYTEATFHSTDAAQDARTVCVERLAKKLSVGLSVGFMMDYGDDDHPAYQYFETGQKLLDFAKANGYDMGLFDVKGIKACKGYCRGILAIAELLEYSIVPVPCNKAAQASEAKGLDPETGGSAVTAATMLTERDFEAFLRDAGYSRRDATALTLHGFKALGSQSPQRDAEEPPAETPPTEGTLPPADETRTDPAAENADTQAADLDQSGLDQSGLEHPDPKDAELRALSLRTLELRSLELRTTALRAHLSG